MMTINPNWFCVKELDWNENTMRFRHNAANLLENPNKSHPIARSLGRGIWCLLWVHKLIYILPRQLQWWMQYDVILDRVMAALGCNFLQHKVSASRHVAGPFHRYYNIHINAAYVLRWSCVNMVISVSIYRPDLMLCWYCQWLLSSTGC